jgi:Tfp pilus assembly protein FimT
MRRTPYHTDSAGFSLVETMVIVVILGIVLTAALPNLWDYVHRDRVRAASEDFEAICGVARVRATATRNLHRVVYAPGSGSYYVERRSGGGWDFASADTMSIPATVQMNGEGGGDPTNHMITFGPSGTVAATDAPAIVRFFNAEGDTSIVSIVRTGRISVRHN